MEGESSSRSSTEGHLRVGIVGRPHGKDGAFVVAEPTERIELLDPARIVTVAGSERTVEWRRGTRARPLLKLEGADVTDGDQRIGWVRDVLPMPSADVLQVERAGREELLVPVVGDAVRAIDVKGRRVDIDLGFLDAT